MNILSVVPRFGYRLEAAKFNTGTPAEVTVTMTDYKEDDVLPRGVTGKIVRLIPKDKDQTIKGSTKASTSGIHVFWDFPSDNPAAAPKQDKFFTGAELSQLKPLVDRLSTRSGINPKQFEVYVKQVTPAGTGLPEVLAAEGVTARLTRYDYMTTISDGNNDMNFRSMNHVMDKARKLVGLP